MTDGSRLSHAYGSAEDIPALLDQIEADPSAERWNDLWSALCHQGSVYSASFAAIPRLTTIAAVADPKERLSALHLAAAIVAGADQPHGAGDVRVKYAQDIAALLRMANEHLRTSPDRTEYIYLLEALLAFEGVPVWGEDLAWGLVNGEYGVSCPNCETGLFIAIGDYGHFSTSGDYALDDNVEKAPLRPAGPGDLDGIGQRLHALALTDGQKEVATAVTYLFGSARCTDCGTDFAVADQVGDPY
ncbi:hypothetical protein OG455_05915 [Kitasatospora sp. NBC_01287]|uniref:hypothetical protein n=1 Tax=Kitasatospora sp. NBC_01287 TaxID=2903573 RepID=UPI0022521D28|nr:hypothetical protein [Kitasatospora sp. NBC_01287]MCX4745064.1 hypothetical protein [Kitasatospora sp. NBC_01287]